MHPKLHHFLYGFFIQGLDLDRIAAIHETSWHEVAKVLDSEPAKELMRSAIRVERLRSIAENLASRRSALRNLGAVADSLDRTPSGMQSRRRAADAILRGTKPGTRSARAARPTSAPNPRSQTTPLAPPPPPAAQLAPVTKLATHASSAKPTQPTIPDSRAHTSRKPVRTARAGAKKSAQLSRTTNPQTSNSNTIPSRQTPRTVPHREHADSS
ncbi:MAG: hypothetical protein JNK16_11985 [Phycisphaerales bacterium]|nr:hypothetical protein [Phycisphaerales bacterium]